MFPVNSRVRRFIAQSHIDEKIGVENIVDHIDKALVRCSEFLAD
jgi:hypothetical protein